ncbi:MAG: DUF1573 domain-containing protein [bacterium]|nr:DUF1573 domain-containing protein [bacterium]
MELSARFGYIRKVTGILLFVIAVFMTAMVQAQPALEIESPGFDFGTVLDNSTLVHHIWLKSAGDDTLEIVDIKTGCGCITAPLEESRLGPGDSALLTLHWRFHSADELSTREPYLFCNDRPGPHRLLLRAEAAPDDGTAATVSCRPRKIEFDRIDRRKDYRRVFTIHNRSDSSLAVALVSTVDGAFSLELPDSVAALGSATGIVILGSEFADKEFERSFTLEFLGGDESAYRVSLVVSRGDFSFRPTLTTKIDTTDSNTTKR